MTIPSSSSTEQAAQLARLKQFLSWILPIACGFALLECVLSAVFHDVPTGLTAIVMFACVGVLGIARAQLDAGKLRPAVTTVCSSLLGSDIVIALLQPGIFPT